MDFDSLLSFDVRPAALELFLHIAPDCTRLVVELVNFDLGRLLKLIKSEFALNDGRFYHEVLELGKGRIGFVSAPSCLHFDCCKDWAIWTFVFIAWIIDCFIDLNSV